MEDNEARAVLCPFCGAPQRAYIPADTLQVKCEYCGGVFLTKPSMMDDMFRCVNHPQKMGVGACNDCAQSFCGDCLRYYYVKTDRERVGLYLCPNCLRRRHAEKADASVYLGLALMSFGVLFAIVNPSGSLVVGLLFGVFGAGLIVYGSSMRMADLGELTVNELRERVEVRRAEVEAAGGVDVEGLYDDLLRRYVSHWGAVGGVETLRTEIMAFTMHGESFEEAVKKIYARQRK